MTPKNKNIAILILLLIYCGIIQGQRPKILTSSSTNNLCTGASITLTSQYPHVSYQWQKWSGTAFVDISGANSNNYSATSTGDYRMRVGVSNVSDTITLNAATALSITDNLPTTGELFPTSLTYQLMVSTANPPDYLSIDWYCNGVLIPTSPLTMQIRLNKPGNYMAVANGCGAERSNVDQVKYETANPNWDATTYSTGLTISTAGSISSAPGTGFIIGNEIVVANGGDLTLEGEFNFNGCFGIKVESGGKLTVTNSSVLSSSNQWKGILVEPGGELIVNNNSYICDAVSGIIKQGTGPMYIENSTFGRNALHIAIAGHSGAFDANIRQNYFGHLIDSSSALVCSSYGAYNSLTLDRGVNIHIEGTGSNSIIKIMENTASWIDSTINGYWHTGWLSASNQHEMEIVLNQVYGFYNYGMRFTNCDNLDCIGNDVKNIKKDRSNYGYPYPSTYPRFGHGLYFKDVDNATITDNNVENWIFGAEYYENIVTNSLFNLNKLRNCKYGLVVSYVQNPIDYTGTNNSSLYSSGEIQLNTECNLFKFNDYGIIGTGDLIDQGSSGMSAGNRFYDVGSGGALNSINNIIWGLTGSSFAFDYYCNNLNDDPSPSNNGNIILDNVSTNGSNNLPLSSGKSYYSLQAGIINPCTNILFSPILSSNNINETNSVNIFPNPSNYSIQIDGAQDGVLIKFLSVDGRLLKEVSYNQEEKMIFVDDLPSGVYIIKLEIGLEIQYLKWIKS